MNSLLLSFLEPSRDESATISSKATASPSLRVAIQLAQEENDAEGKGADREDDNVTRGDYGQGKIPLGHSPLAS
jgi:hypothetical protein